MTVRSAREPTGRYLLGGPIAGKVIVAPGACRRARRVHRLRKDEGRIEDAGHPLREDGTDLALAGPEAALDGRLVRRRSLALGCVLDADRVVRLLGCLGTYGVPWSVMSCTPSSPTAASATTRSTSSEHSRTSMANASNRRRSRSPRS